MSDLPAAPTELRRLLRRLTNADRRLRAAVAAKVGLTTIEWEAVEQIADGPRGSTPGELATELGLTTGGVTALLIRLEDRAIVIRSPHPDDRRRVVLALTPEFAEEARRYTHSFASAADRFLAGLPEDLRTALMELSHTYRQIVESAADELSQHEEPEREAVELWM